MRVPASHLVLVLAPLVACTNGLDESVTPDSVDAPTLLTLREPVHQLDALAREPMLVEHPDGTLFVTGYEGRNESPDLWKSGDGGATWERVDVGSPADGAVGNSCVDLAVAPDGTLYFITMGFIADKMEGTHVTVGVSHDVGASWTWTYLSQDQYDDRPWVEVAPDGTAHAIWNDGAGVSYAVSTDGDRSWTERERNPSPGRLEPSGDRAQRRARCARHPAVSIWQPIRRGCRSDRREHRRWQELAEGGSTGNTGVGPDV